MKNVVVLAAALLLSCPPMLGQATQTFQAAQGTEPKAGPPSPSVAPDGRVTFSLYAPGASTVTVLGDYPISQFEHSAFVLTPMKKDDQGVWSVTVGPLKPDFYAYNFIVDGARELDPRNILVARDGDRYLNWAIVPGPASANYQLNDVPHGTVHAVWYPSAVLKMSRRVLVYTPPGYEASSQRYPVFYLLHGGGGDEEAWSDMGRAPEIFDNLLAQGKTVPMIVVMINANWWQSVSPNDRPTRISDRGPGIEKIPESIIHEIVPFIDGQYRTKTDRDDRAIAGLSRGGAQTLLTALNDVKDFSWVGVFSGGLPLLPGMKVDIALPADASTRRGPDVGHSIDPSRFKQLFPSLSPDLNGQLHLLYLSIGNKDGLVESWQVARRILDEKGVKYTWVERDGYGHEWSFWRLALGDFSSRLFKVQP